MNDILIWCVPVILLTGCAVASYFPDPVYYNDCKVYSYRLPGYTTTDGCDE